MNHLSLVVFTDDATSFYLVCLVSTSPQASSLETAGKAPTPTVETKSFTMVATSTLKTKSSECITDLVDRRYDQACIEKGIVC